MVQTATARAAMMEIMTKGCVAKFFLMRLLTLFLDRLSKFENLIIFIPFTF